MKTIHQEETITIPENGLIFLLSMHALSIFTNLVIRLYWLNVQWKLLSAAVLLLLKDLVVKLLRVSDIALLKFREMVVLSQLVTGLVTESNVLLFVPFTQRFVTWSRVSQRFVVIVVIYFSNYALHYHIGIPLSHESCICSLPNYHCYLWW